VTPSQPTSGASRDCAWITAYSSTIPVDIRRKFRIEEGTRIAFLALGNAHLVRFLFDNALSPLIADVLRKNTVDGKLPFANGLSLRGHWRATRQIYLGSRALEVNPSL